MGLQKYRADRAGKKQANDGTPWFSDWNWEPTLSLIRNCHIDNIPLDMECEFRSPRTVYVIGDADTYFSIPAACRYRVHKGRGGEKVLHGYITLNENNEYYFRAYNRKRKELNDVVCKGCNHINTRCDC